MPGKGAGHERSIPGRERTSQEAVVVDPDVNPLRLECGDADGRVVDPGDDPCSADRGEDAVNRSGGHPTAMDQHRELVAQPVTWSL